MKNLLLLLSFLFIINVSFSQESFKKRYTAVKTIGKIKLVKDTTYKFEDLTKNEQKFIRDNYKGKKLISYSREEIINGKKSIVFYTDTINDEFFKNQTLVKQIHIPHCASKVFLKQEKNKIYVNPYIRNGNERDVYYYKFENRQSIQLNYSEWTFSGLTIPLKYRFKDKNGVDEDFSADINGNAMFTYGRGKSNFLHREKVDNLVNSWKVSGALFAGVSTVELDSMNTSTTKSASPLAADEKVTKGLISFGFGALYNYNKIGFGLFLGFDYGVGDLSNRWVYKGDPWLGFGIGYSIF